MAQDAGPEVPAKTEGKGGRGVKAGWGNATRRYGRRGTNLRIPAACRALKTIRPKLLEAANEGQADKAQALDISPSKHLNLGQGWLLAPSPR